MNLNIINELLSIEAFAEELRQKCYRARKKLERIHAPASPKGGKKPLDDSEISRLLAARKKSILKKTK